MKYLNDIPFEAGDFGAVIEKIKKSSGGLILSLNPETFYLTQTKGFFKKLFQDTLINLPDGAGIVFAVKFLTGQRIKRLPGVELIETLFKSDSGPYFFLGSKPEVINQLKNVVQSKYKVQMTGAQDGYFSLEQEQSVLKNIQSLNPKFILVGMGSPRQEEIAFKLKELCPKTFIIPCGGSLDVISLSTPRAPLFFRILNLEWAYRLITQPFRIKRSLPKLIWFFLLVITKKITIRS